MSIMPPRPQCPNHMTLPAPSSVPTVLQDWCHQVFEAEDWYLADESNGVNPCEDFIGSGGEPLQWVDMFDEGLIQDANNAQTEKGQALGFVNSMWETLLHGSGAEEEEALEPGYLNDCGNGEYVTLADSATGYCNPFSYLLSSADIGADYGGYDGGDTNFWSSAVSRASPGLSVHLGGSGEFHETFPSSFVHGASPSSLPGYQCGQASGLDSGQSFGDHSMHIHSPSCSDELADEILVHRSQADDAVDHLMVICEIEVCARHAVSECPAGTEPIPLTAALHPDAAAEPSAVPSRFSMQEGTSTAVHLPGRRPDTTDTNAEAVVVNDYKTLVDEPGRCFVTPDAHRHHVVQVVHDLGSPHTIASVSIDANLDAEMTPFLPSTAVWVSMTRPDKAGHTKSLCGVVPQGLPDGVTGVCLSACPYVFFLHVRGRRSSKQ